ncbi:MAG TPA: branched-chain amino acid ABC transporter permease, partial [Beijerinckiaceae bacterium]|nr:branched-chain amino acid ABC transporter permease [Beijerinckiaceae bacterium]
MLAQQLANGIVSGAIYALFALGFTLMFGVLGVINLTYGVYFSAGAMVALFATTWARLPIALAIPLAGVTTGLAAIVVDGLLLTPLRRARAPELASLMVTLGATLLLYSVASAVLGTDIRRFPQNVFEGSVFTLGGVRISESQVLIMGAAVIAVVCLIYVMQATRLGLAIRALAENSDAAELMGVPTETIVRIVSFASGALGGVAGVLIGLNSDAIEPYM